MIGSSSTRCRQKCFGCIYIGAALHGAVCDFAVITGFPRLVPIEDCRFFMDERPRTMADREATRRDNPVPKVREIREPPKKKQRGTALQKQIRRDIEKRSERAEEKRRKQEQMAELYAEGMNDREIAAAIGVSASGVQEWRTSRRLPAVTQVKYDEQEALRMELWRSGLNDTQIGRATGASPKSIWQWRARRHLQANYGRKQDGRTEASAPTEERHEK